MKNLFVVALVCSIALLMSSCKKDRTCTCTDVDGEVLISETFVDVSKSDAEDACDVLQATWSLVDPGVSCEID